MNKLKNLISTQKLEKEPKRSIILNKTLAEWDIVSQT